MLKKLLKYLVLPLLILSAISLLAFWQLANFLEIKNSPQEVDAIVVISGGGLERVEKGVELFKSGYAKHLILSGAAYDDGTSNAASMRNFAISHGIRSTQIILEEKSKNTYENAYYVAEIIKEYKLESIILVTSSYHQRRAYNTFKKVLPEEIKILNLPAQADFWESGRWWQEEKSKQLVLTETGKLIYSKLSGNYGQKQ